MSKVDWSLAPSDATHSGIFNGKFSCWYMLDGDQWHYGSEVSGGWEKVVNNLPISVLVRRPQPKPWSGPEDGLPPAGTVCEVKVKGFSAFCPATILFCQDNALVISWNAEGVAHPTTMDSVEIRAIKTPEQQAAEKRETSIAEMAKVLPSAKHECWTCNPDGSVKPYENTYEILGLLVDAGFEREVV